MFVFGEDSSNSKWSIEGLYLFVSAKDLHMRKGSAAMLALAHLRRAARAHPWVPATWNFQVCWSIAPMPKTTLVYFLEDQSPHLPQQIAKQAQDGLAHVKRSDDFPNHQTSLNQGPKGTCSVKNCCGVSEELARGIGFSAAAAQPGRIPCSIGGKPRFFGSVDEAARAQSQHSDMQRRPTTSRKWKNCLRFFSSRKSMSKENQQPVTLILQTKRAATDIGFANLATSRSPTHWFEKSLLDLFTCLSVHWGCPK